ncbi:MAG: hypothetical protein ACREAY_09405, partial [Nitrososphaera sp.]|uniref:hypothetical protein n=1 Tax=Nitrososphaera sp. TaxID=1971748 RepID=UPI003D6F21EC
MRASVANILPIATATFFVLIVSLIGVPLAIENAYGHGISLCMAPTGGCALSKNNEQYSSAYSDNKLDMNDDGRGVLTITGTIKNRYHDHELRLVRYVSVDARPSNPFGSFELNDLLLSYYPLYNAHASWYFKTEYDNQPNIIIIKPREEIDYEIKAYPLKAGVYHVHSSFVFDYVNDGEYRYYQSVGRGETVTVVGSHMMTAGEVTQLI